MRGSAFRQDFLVTALEWVSRNYVGDYMSRHRHYDNISELKIYFSTVIDWVSGILTSVEKEMQGLEWERLYETYKSKPYNPQTISEQVKTLYADHYVKDRKGIFEYVLSGMMDKKLLCVRVFDEATKKSTYVDKPPVLK